MAQISCYIWYDNLFRRSEKLLNLPGNYYLVPLKPYPNTPRMNILLVHNAIIPVHTYGASERIIWWLGKELIKQGHNVRYLVKKGSTCPFAPVLEWNEAEPLNRQIPEDTDLVHLHCPVDEPVDKPHLFTVHDNCEEKGRPFDPNTVFACHNHAQRHGGKVYVYPGIDLEAYGQPMTDNRRLYFHFLGNASWKVKNVQGAIDLATRAGVRLHIIGGSRVNFRRGLRIYLSPTTRFHGMLGDDGKKAILQASKGLLFPVLWHEPFGLSIIESLYFGCPLFGTPYGSLPEVLGRKPGEHSNRQWAGEIEAFHSDFGFLSLNKDELIEAIREADGYNRQQCRDYVAAHFTATRMTADYLALYERVLNGEKLHEEAFECPG